MREPRGHAVFSKRNYQKTPYPRDYLNEGAMAHPDNSGKATRKSGRAHEVPHGLSGYDVASAKRPRRMKRQRRRAAATVVVAVVATVLVLVAEVAAAAAATAEVVAAATMTVVLSPTASRNAALPNLALLLRQLWSACTRSRAILQPAPL
jgi:hypothetical protein